jgi:hypothetical protein
VGEIARSSKWCPVQRLGATTESHESEKVIIFTAFWKYFTKFCEK